jgi:hypothetical protein
LRDGRDCLSDGLPNLRAEGQLMRPASVGKSFG